MDPRVTSLDRDFSGLHVSRTSRRVQDWREGSNGWTAHFRLHSGFGGDDWYEHESWNIYERQLAELEVQVIYLPYTKGTSSTLINRVLLDLRKDGNSGNQGQDHV